MIRLIITLSLMMGGVVGVLQLPFTWENVLGVSLVFFAGLVTQIWWPPNA